MKFSLLTKPNWEVAFKLFNFNRFSDLGGFNRTVLSKAQMSGDEPIWWNITLKDVPEEFWHGSRVYMEACEFIAFKQLQIYAKK